ncbi:MAG TPA: DEAD/DEAH box helicase family protein, partial [Herpetosiphonaceae bacterium]|nr:DEAD/DEAH box helicase family protein [Herpetosiphonaceae bacterium]
MGNFTFLQAEWPDLHQTARQVEQYIQPDPRSACFYARRALELAVQWLYDHDSDLHVPYDTTLVAMLNESSFRANVPEAVITKAQLIRKEGNQAVHSQAAISVQTALGVAIELRHVLYWLARTYTKKDPGTIPNAFDEKQLPTSTASLVQQSIVQLQAMDARLKAQDEALRQQQAANAALQKKLADLQADIAAQKVANSAVPDTHDYSEATTRKRIIDVMLRESGWNPAAPNASEYPVVGMPNASKTGSVDYVLWGANGLPLALVEAKRTSKDPYAGKQQARLYADCLERMHGQRPIVFYTNGFQTWIWDDTRYPPREVQGFYTRDELDWLIQRRTTAQPLSGVPLSSSIVNRPYQQEAIRAMSEHLARNYRKGLLVMATGTGKTRVAIALVDLLMRAGHVKRVLFLADRSALVRQTTNAFKAHLSTSTPVNLTEAAGKVAAPTARLVVSTYQTMMHTIDETDDAGEKLFSPGHFDLVLVDEAHRSVYRKYGAIFNYFDSLLIGLTATPKDEVDHNTYHLFDLEDGVPTFAYDLEQAVLDGYLVPYRAFDLPTKFISQGIHYDDLSDEEQAAWDELDWGDSDAIPDSVAAAAVNAWLFNEDTADRILKALMEHGLKVAGGDRLGKTIIFAKNHKHAEFIERRFDANYPHMAGQFARVIDNQVNYAQSLIDDFSEPAKAPHIAISVDMLDTGIDVPEVVNLVFFKIVRSKTKFFQMIGRGTRLRPDLYGPGEDKDHFLIFDACMNFEFFNHNPEGARSVQAEPLGQTLFKKRLELFRQTRALLGKTPGLAPLVRQLGDTLHAQVAAMNVENFIVRPQRQYVEPFQQRKRWETLSRT